MIDIFAFADIIDVPLKVTRYANQDGRWSAHFDNSDIKEGTILAGIYGNGKSPEEAISDYKLAISGKVLVINAHSANRKEYKVPNLI